ncbi:MAG: TIGR04282 family arsenosugar biosynthesis glycosyltransferase [Candidatus Zixiibacteriota bacterium]
MPPKKKNETVITICIQEPFEDGSSMDFGPAIQGDELRFLHQAFITDTINNAFEVPGTDIRLYFIDHPDRNRLVKIITDYIMGKLKGKKLEEFKKRFSMHPMEKERWGLRIEKIFLGCFAEGYANVLLVGSRTPTITAQKMKTAIKMLKASDVVFGPTPDGRYYTIGKSKSYQIKLADFDWKSPKIYSEVAEAFAEAGLQWSELEIWYAVETPEELEMMARDINQYRFEGDEKTAHETEIVMERILAKLEP